jgi:recombination protein RecT
MSYEIVSSDIYASKDAFCSALTDKSISFEQEAGFALQALSNNDYSMKIATQNRQSVVNAVTNIAAIGISLNPAKKQAYLVPRDGKICLDISYMGLMDLAMATGSIRWAQAALVYANDTFALNGMDKPPTHSFNPFSKDRGAIVGVYVIVKTLDGDYLTHPMAIEDVFAIRDRSQGWKSGKSTPWRTDEGEMIKKTCVKQAYKYWPKTDRLEEAIHHLNIEGEGLEALAPKTQQTRHTPMPSVVLEDKRESVIVDVAQAVKDRFDVDDVIGAYGEYIGITDGDEKIALWRLLPSHIRSALKKHGESLKEQK